MDEIKKFLRMMDKEALVELAASMLFNQLVNLTTLATDIAKLESKRN